MIDNYSFSEHDFPFWDGYRQSFKIKDFVKCSDWMNNNFRLSSAYAVQGRITLFPWQIVLADAIHYFDTIYEIAAVQTGKSLITEGHVAWYTDNENMNILMIYAKKDTVEEVFDERLKPMIKDVPAIRKYWSGDENDLTKKKMKLRHLTIRTGSAGLKTDIATFNYGVIIGDELAKWPKKDFSQKKAIEGRQKASKMMGKSVKEIYCTSPEDQDDPSYVACHKPGMIWFRPHYKCPHCSFWQYLEDYNIHEVPNSKGEKDHNTERIRIEKAAKYICPECKKEITEQERFDASFNVKWLTVDKKTDFYDVIKDPKRSRKAVLQWNRLVDTTWTFVDCLCAFFDAENSTDPNDKKTYENEDMARWTKKQTNRLMPSYLDSKKRKYKMWGNEAFVPDGVKVVLLGIDTQDSGFYYVLRGFGYNYHQWLLRANFIECSMHDDLYKDPMQVYRKVYESITQFPLKKKDGSEVMIFSGIIDEGGHRKNDTDKIIDCWNIMNAYKGSSQRAHPLIDQKKTGLLQGNTENLSRRFAKSIESSMFYLPLDTPRMYKDQLLTQYDVDEILKNGKKVTKWFCEPNDHLRDCENMIEGLALHLGLRDILFNDKKTEELTKNLTVSETPKEVMPDSMISGFLNEMRNHGFNY